MDALHKTLVILHRTEEIDSLLDRDISRAEREDLQEELFRLRQEIETLRHEVLSIPLAAICDVPAKE